MNWLSRKAWRFALLFLVQAYNPAAAEQIDSGYQTIQGTRVYTEIFHERGYARFSNECGSQTLTQGQLQSGAIPSNIIPCPRNNRGSSLPPGAVDCGGNRYCDAGNICIKGNKCLPTDSPRYCGGGSYCDEGSFCDGDSCYSMDSPRYCGDGTHCSEGQFCDNDNLCYSTSEARYCGNGRFCDSDYFCDRSMPEGSSRCVPTSSARYCGDGAYCNEGMMCTDDNMCVAENTEPPPSYENGSQRELAASDCSCISILPQSQAGTYQVTNSCGPLSVSVKFGGDTLHLSARTDAFTDWADAGVVSSGSPGLVRSPGHWTITSILGMTLKNDTSTFTCMF